MLPQEAGARLHGSACKRTCSFQLANDMRGCSRPLGWFWFGLHDLRGSPAHWKTQTQVAGQLAVAILGDHFTVPVAIELVDQHAIEPGDVAELPGSCLGDFHERLVRLHVFDAAADTRIERFERLPSVCGGCSNSRTMP